MESTTDIMNNITLEDRINGVIKKATLNEFNLNLKMLNDNINDVINKNKNTDTSNKLKELYEQSTTASTPTIELTNFLINRNREDVLILNLTHYINIRCKDNNNKSCIIPIYKIPTNKAEMKKIKKSNMLIQTLNYKYAIFIRDIYSVSYDKLMDSLDNKYNLDVGLFKE